MPPVLPSPSAPIHWIFDWDGTLTKRDTLDALVNLAAKHRATSLIAEKWKAITDAYFADYERTLAAHTLPSTVSEEKDFVRKLESVEQKSIDRVSNSGIFAGLTPKEIESGAAEAIASNQVQIREGCHDFFRHLRSRVDGRNARPDAVNILSVNWSQRFIAACLRSADLDFGRSALELIYSNELEGIRRGEEASGRICVDTECRMISSRDKLGRLEQLRKNDMTTGIPIPLIYIGDSWTDFECLLAADLGICVRDDPITSTQQRLLDCFTRLGVRCPRLRDAEEVDSWRVVWIKDYCEILDWMQSRI